MKAHDLWFPVAMIGIGAALIVTISAADRAVEAHAAVKQTSAAAVTTTAEELPPDAIWASDMTYAPVESIEMVEPVPVETEPEVDENDLYWLSHVICGEAQCYSRECQIAVGSVVLNRVNSKRYPNTLEGVITQRHQYSSFTDGNFHRKPTETNIEVARELLMHGSQLPSNVYFQAQFKQGDFTYAKIDGEYFCGLEE